MPGFRLWLGLTLFFIYGFAFYVPATHGTMFLVSPRHHWEAYAELIAAGVVAWKFIQMARVTERMPPDQPGMGFVNFGLILAVVGILGGFFSTAISDPTVGFYLAIAMSRRLEWLQAASMSLISLGALRIILTLEPRELDEAEEPATDTASASPASSGAASPVTPAPAPFTPVVVADASAALRAAQDKVARNPEDLVAHAGLHNLLSKEADARTVLEHARQYIAALLRQRRAEPAFELLGKCFARDAAFKPHADNVLPLARFALMLKDHNSALRLLNGFSKANPGHADTPHILFQSARALMAAGNRDMAKRYLEALIVQYPEHAIRGEGKAMLDALNTSRPAPG